MFRNLVKWMEDLGRVLLILRGIIMKRGRRRRRMLRMLSATPIKKRL
jgi:hypothetical protein